jgi:hypothetical protein
MSTTFINRGTERPDWHIDVHTRRIRDNDGYDVIEIGSGLGG